MIRQAFSIKQHSLRSGAEKVRCNFIQSTKDQEDLFNLPKRDEDTIYQYTKTAKNSTQRQNSMVEEKYDNWMDFESFVGNKDDLGRSIDNHSMQGTSIKNINNNSYLINGDNQQSPSLHFNHPNLRAIKKENLIEAEKSIHNTFSSSMSNEVIKLQQGSGENNRSEFVVSPMMQQAESPVTLQNSQSLNQSSPKKGDKYDSDQETGLTGVWKKKSLIIITKVKQFVIQIKKYSDTLKFQQMEKDQFMLLKDQSSDYKYYFMNDYIKEQQNLLSKWEKMYYAFKKRVNLYLQKKQHLRSLIDILKSGVIEPYSKKKLLWESFLFISILWQIFYIPFFISFQSNQQSVDNVHLFQNILKLQVPIILYIDILFNFISAYYSKGKLVLNRRQIFVHYIKKGRFLIDLLIATLFLINISLNIKWLNYIIFIKMIRLSSIISNFEERVNLRYKYSSLVDFSNLAFNILFIAHICGCFFFLVADIEKDYGVNQTWVEFYNLDNKSVTEQYITSIYWAVITMITLGYGDFVPKTSYERIFVIFITLISCGVFAYSINQIGTIITNMTKKSSQFQEKIAHISGYLQERGIKSNMLMKIKQNFAYLQRESEKDMEVHNMISTELSKSLRKEVFREMYVQVLQGCKTFKLNFSETFLQQLAPSLKEKKFGPEEVIYEQDVPNHNLYFIIRGQVSLYLNMNGEKRQIKLLSKNDVFGEQPFFSQAVSNHTAISVNVAKVVYVNLTDFLNIIKSHPADFETYCMMKDKLNLFSTSKRLGLKCYCCGQFQHFLKECPFVNYIPNKEKILINHNIELKQERDHIVNNRRSNFIKHEKSITFQKQLQEEIVNFLIEKNYYENLNELMQILRNQEIIFEQQNQSTTENEEHGNQDKDLNYKSSLTQKSLQVLYPKMNNDTNGTEGIISELTSPTKPKMITSFAKQGSSQFSQPQKRKIQRTQTSQTGKTESLAFLGASSSKQINSENNYYPTPPQQLDRVESRRKSKNPTSFLNSQILRESSRKIILEEIIESQKLIQINQTSINSLHNYTQNSNNNNNSLLNNQSQTNNPNSNQSTQFLQSQQASYIQTSQNASIYAHGPNTSSAPSPIINNNQQFQFEQLNKLIYRDNRSQSESFSQKNKKMTSSVTSLSQRAQKKSNNNTNSTEQKKLRELNDAKFMQQLIQATQQISNITNPIPFIPPLQSNIVNITTPQNQQITQQSSQIINGFEKMSMFEVFFPHNNYQVVIENYNHYMKMNADIQRMDSSIVKKERIKQIRLSMFTNKGNLRSHTQTSQRNSKGKMKSQYYVKNNN